MAKYYGVIGYAETVEKAKGVWEDSIVERVYSGDILRNNRRFQSGEKLNNDLEVTNEFSIVCDPYAQQNFHNIRYISWMGSRWIVRTVEVEFPRLRLTIGGIYNGPTPSTS